MMKPCTLIKEVYQVFLVQVFENQIVCNFQKRNLSNQGSIPSGSVINQYKRRLQSPYLDFEYQACQFLAGCTQKSYLTNCASPASSFTK